ARWRPRIPRCGACPRSATPGSRGRSRESRQVRSAGGREKCAGGLALLAALGGALLATFLGAFGALLRLLALADQLGLLLEFGLWLLDLGRRRDGRDDGLLEVVQDLDPGGRRDARERHRVRDSH